MGGGVEVTKLAVSVGDHHNLLTFNHCFKNFVDLCLDFQVLADDVEIHSTLLEGVIDLIGAGF